jgi:hypothetical protein
MLSLDNTGWNSFKYGDGQSDCPRILAVDLNIVHTPDVFLERIVMIVESKCLLCFQYVPIILISMTDFEWNIMQIIYVQWSWLLIADCWLLIKQVIRDYIFWLAVWNFFHFPFHIWDVILPIDELHDFSRWLSHHQPVLCFDAWDDDPKWHGDVNLSGFYMAGRRPKRWFFTEDRSSGSGLNSPCLVGNVFNSCFKIMFGYVLNHCWNLHVFSNNVLPEYNTV